MASLADDFRFASTSAASLSSQQEEEVDDPIFGQPSGSNGQDSWRSRFENGRSIFDDEDEDTKPRASTSRLTEQSEAAENSQLYAILNVEKDCSQEEILKRYRSLAIAFHPDKHRDPDLKASAQTRFEKVQYAYEVLNDPKRRAVYDLLGEEGLKSDWEVGQRLQTAEELKAEYERSRLKRAQADIENLIRSRAREFLVRFRIWANSAYQTEATIALDASRRLDKSDGLLAALASVAAADVRQLFMKASTVSVLTPSTTLTYQGSMLARRGQGGGNLLVTLRHQYNSQLGIEVGTTALEPKRLTTKISYALDKHSAVNFDSTLVSPYLPPLFNLTYATRVADKVDCFARVSSGSSYSFLSALMPLFQPFAGSPSTLMVGGTYAACTVEATANQFGEVAVSGNYGNVRLLGGGRQRGWKLSTNVGANSQGQATFGVSTEKRLTENTHIGIGMGVVVTTGALTLRLRVNRLGQRLSVPILLSSAASPRLILGTVFIPAVSIASMQYFYLTPRSTRQVAERLKRLREEQQEDMAEKRKEALEAIELLREQTERKAESERAKDGLVIVEAIYTGTGSGIEPDEVRKSALDVRIPVQALISARHGGNEAESTSVLAIPGGRSKAQLIGFYDVMVGSKKKLLIKYTFRGRYHEASFDDFQPVALPMRSHLVE